MSTHQQQPDPRQIESYLDGTMPAAERAEFLRRYAGDQQLQSNAELQQRIDEVLRQKFASGSAAALVARLRAEVAAPPMPATLPLRRRRGMGLVAAAAAVLVWGGLGWYFLAPLLERQPQHVVGPQDLASQYRSTVEQGFHPLWVCDDDHQFASTFHDRYGQGLLLSSMPEGTKMVGLTYYGGPTNKTTSMLARVDETPILVYVDRLEDDGKPEQPPAESGLHLYRKELGPLVLYELSPLDAPRVMDYLYEAEVPAK